MSDWGLGTGGSGLGRCFLPNRDRKGALPRQQQTLRFLAVAARNAVDTRYRAATVREPVLFAVLGNLPDRLLLFPYSRRFSRNHGEELDEALLSVGAARTLLGFEHGLRQ